MHLATWSARQRKLAGALAVLMLVMAYWLASAWPMPWHGRVGGAAVASQLPIYQATIEQRVVAGIDDNLSGLTYNPRTRSLFGVINRPPAVVELSTNGRLLRKMALSGAKDPEGIAHIRDDWFAIADERSNRIHWVQIGPDQSDISLHNGTSLQLDKPAIKNFGIEGLGWDSQRQQLFAVTEKWPMQVLVVDGPVLRPGEHVVQTQVQSLQIQDTAGLPTTDLASIEVDPRSGNLLLLGEESSVLYEYTRAGELLGVMPLWSGMSGLTNTIGQPEGVAIDDEGTLYIVSEPNLFYRFEKRSQ